MAEELKREGPPVEAAKPETPKRKRYTVETQKRGLNLREAPSKESRIVRLLENGAKVTLDAEADAPEGWAAVKGGGYVMTAYLK